MYPALGEGQVRLWNLTNMIGTNARIRGCGALPPVLILAQKCAGEAVTGNISWSAQNGKFCVARLVHARVALNG